MKLIASDALSDCPVWTDFFADTARQRTLAQALDRRDWATIWQDMEPVVGLEMHIGLKSESKLFSAARKGQAGWLDMGYPGALPLLDPAAVECAIQLGKSVHAQLATTMFFERKRYAYPDLSKGYQTTQKTSPVWTGGALVCEWGSLPLVRAQVEEDAASVERHAWGFKMDFSRAGAPLLEIVSDVAELTRERVIETLRTLYRQALLVDATEGKIEEGQMKSDINLSLRPRGSAHFSERWEIKGISSFDAAGRAFDDAMAQRLHLLLDDSLPMNTRLGKAATLGFVEESGVCSIMREKLSDHQYRFLPCPDLGEIDVPDLDTPAHAYVSTLKWLETIGGEAFSSQRWQSILEHRVVLPFLGKRRYDDRPCEPMLWMAVAWLMEHPHAERVDLWDALRASSDTQALRVGLSLLERTRWTHEAFTKALQDADDQRKQWIQAQAFLATAFPQCLVADLKFAAAWNDVLLGKTKAMGYIQGKIMAALKQKGFPARGEWLSAWLMQRIEHKD